MSSRYTKLVKGPVARLNYINGQRIASTGDHVSCYYPATGEVNCVFGSTTEAEFATAIDHAKAAQIEWAKWSPLDRGDVLRACAELLEKNREEIAYTEVRDIAKTINEARGDVQSAIDSMKYHGGTIPAVLNGEHVRGSGYRATSDRLPLGVVAGIGAWNYPIQIAAFKAAPALACGNAVIVKPSEFTPLNAVILGELLTEAGLPNGLYQVVQGVGPVGRMITESPEIKKISFTGSVPTGQAILAASGKFVRPVTLELGGKSPLIIFDDFDIDQAVQGAMQANFYSQGQVCSNGTRVFVHESIYDTFKTRLVEQVKSIKVGDPMDETVQMGALSSAEHLAKVLEYLNQAKNEGANVLCGGARNDSNGGYFMNPAVVECTDDMTISTEEHFGPICQLYKFGSETEAIERANNSDLGLAAGVFTNDHNRVERVTHALDAGTVYVNCYNLAPPEMGFGGFKYSGIGKENGTEFVHQFTRLKCTYHSAEPMQF